MLKIKPESSVKGLREKLVDCVIVGKESVGKSQLVSSLTGTSANHTNFRGSTVNVELCQGRDRTFIDIPGILRKSDTQTTTLALAALRDSDLVVLVAQATTLDDDLTEMLPLVVGKRGIVVVTYWDKVEASEEDDQAIERLSHDAGVPFVAIDARKLTAQDRFRIEKALLNADSFARVKLTKIAGWRIELKPGLLEHRILGPIIAILLLLLPALATIYGANRVADFPGPLVSSYIDVYLAEIFLTCFVAALTIARESSWKSTGLMLARPTAIAVLFSFVLAWGGDGFFRPVVHLDTDCISISPHVDRVDRELAESI